MVNTVHLEEIPYSPDSCELFEHLRDLPHAAILDSSYPYSSAGRYDILVANGENAPLSKLPAAADHTSISAFFGELSAFHREHYAGIQPASMDIPCCGGLLGYIGYEYGNSLHEVSGPDDAGAKPALHLKAYAWCVIQDHLLQRTILVSLPQVSAAERRELLLRLRQPTKTAKSDFKLSSKFLSNVSEQQYREAFARIKAYIEAGDCYQVNLAQRFEATYNGDPWWAYRQLRTVAAAPFSGYIDVGGGNALLSLSPERFLSLHGHRVETSPIKGTRPRYSDPGADQLAAQDLLASEKDRAENLMIVDLLRNDLGRSCVPGSIHVDRLFEIQSFPTVHHLVSTISGELCSSRNAIDLLRDSFPGGSITGAPKKRAMEIIAELEPHRRQAYCGSLMYISADGRMDSNIAIRSLLCRDGNILCWGGGGIVADSKWQQEYQETFDKVGRFLNELETMGH